MRPLDLLRECYDSGLFTDGVSPSWMILNPHAYTMFEAQTVGNHDISEAPLLSAAFGNPVLRYRSTFVRSDPAISFVEVARFA